MTKGPLTFGGLPGDDKQPTKGKAVEITDEEMEMTIPKPVGYHILIAMPDVEETFGDSGLVKAQKTMNTESLLSMVGVVIDMGNEAYGDKTRFPSGPWCKVGDFVMFRSNSGTRFKVAGKEFRLMNDDSIEAVVENPTAIKSV